MKKSLIALIVASSFALAGGSDVNDRDIDPEWGVVPPPVQPPVDNTPDRPQPETDPDFGVDTTPDWGLAPWQPPVDDTPDWGGVVPPPVQPPVDDNSPERPQPDFGNTPDWGGETGDIQVDHNGVIHFNGEQYQITGYDEMDREFQLVDKDGVEFFARYDEGMLKVAYKGQVFVFNDHRFIFAPDFDFGVDTTPDWGVVPPPVQPPVDNTPDRPHPDLGDTPDWGIPNTGHTPERPQPDFGETPDWGVVPPAVQSPVDNAPDRPEPDFGDTPEWGISTAPEVSPAINNIDRNKVRDAVRSRLNG